VGGARKVILINMSVGIGVVGDGWRSAALTAGATTCRDYRYGVDTEITFLPGVIVSEDVTVMMYHKVCALGLLVFGMLDKPCRSGDT
jgi:hypothetical protein